ncbi:MAG: APC family permease [Candidatus Zixiibacteriota bacterium]
MVDDQSSITKKVKEVLIGGSRNLQDQSLFHSISLTAFLAWIGMGADGLSSSCYGPEEAFLALKGHPYLGLIVALASAATVLIISASYVQIIELFPSGGGGYVVASKLLNPTLGMVSGCALLIDYVLTIALSVASGADALFSFLPESMHSYKLGFAVFGVVLLIILNLRGIRESVVPLIPIMVTFVLTHVFVVVYGFVDHASELPTMLSTTASDLSASTSEIGLLGIFILLIKSYSMGAGTYTGIEAVSNGLPMIREPRVENGRKTMRYMAISLAFMALGLMVMYLLYGVEHVPGKTLNAVLFERISQNWSHGLGFGFVTLTLVAEAALLFVAAQTGFLGGPRVLATMALDRWFPTRFSMLSDRLVTQNGILMMGLLAMILIVVSRGSVRFLVVLYSITVFITFVLSQLGMVRHWWNERKKLAHWRRKITIAGIGLILTAFILVAMSVIKFHDGGWLTLLVTVALVAVAMGVKRHYKRTSLQLKRLDDLLVTAIELSRTKVHNGPEPPHDPKARTAILLVNGFNGLGLHTLLTVMRLFEGSFKNFIFVQVGIVDVGNFKGRTEVERLEEHIHETGEKYVDFMRAHGFHAESVHVVGVDVVEALSRLLPSILDRYPKAVMFGGQLVFSKDYIFSRWLHNHTIFAIQKKFYQQGIPIVILPIRV